MPDNPLSRRLITVPLVFLAFFALTMVGPLLLLATAIVDSIRSVTGNRSWIATRIVTFLWVYLLGQIWALLSLLLTTPLPKATKQRITYELQTAWTKWNIKAMKRVFSLRFAVSGDDATRPGPILVLSRHASIVDTLLPAALIAIPHRIRLRYVLKKELLVDPTLDIAGHRIPNSFIGREGAETADSISAIRALASDLESDDGVLIYPEGTRFSERKRKAYTARVGARGGHIGDIAKNLQWVLPPRPRGTLALLEPGTADVVVLAHHGLEGLATVKDIWKGSLAGSTISVRFWRIPRTSIPATRNEQVDWLFTVWAHIDEWIARQQGAP